MGPKAEGKDYYKQAGPQERGFVRKVFQLKPGEGEAFDADATETGERSAVAYLRRLWNEDRVKRGLPPWEPGSKE